MSPQPLERHYRHQQDIADAAISTWNAPADPPPPERDHDIECDNK